MATLLADARVDADDVKEIVDTDLTDVQINAFINTAHRYVDANLLGKSLDADTLTDIELWLSAHFLSMRDPRVSSVSANGLSASYQGKTGEGLKATLYGQQALALDASGTLASLGQKRAVFEVWSEKD